MPCKSLGSRTFPEIYRICRIVFLIVLLNFNYKCFLKNKKEQVLAWLFPVLVLVLLSVVPSVPLLFVARVLPSLLAVVVCGCVFK